MSKLTRWMTIVLMAGGGMLSLAANQALAGVSISVGGNVGLSVDSDAGLVLWDDGKAPGPDYVRVDLSLLGGNVAAPAFWRVKFRKGFVWVDGRWEDDIYVPGFWRPEKARGANWAWVPGHWVGRKWIEGRWRPARRAGYVWIEGHWDRYGEWVEGYWRPTVAPASNMVWEPGYWNSRGVWMAGFWRPATKRGYIWCPGGYDQRGIWVKGRWLRAGTNRVWVKGYWDHQGRWHAGKIAKIPKRGQKYISGHYDRQGAWIAPRWVDEQAWQREMERQTDNYRRDREGKQEKSPIPYNRQEKNYRQDREGSSPAPTGGQVRSIGGEQKYRTQPDSSRQYGDQRDERRDDRGHDRGQTYEPEYSDRQDGDRGEGKVKIPERERSTYRNHSQPQSDSDAKSTNPGLHKGWEKNGKSRQDEAVEGDDDPEPQTKKRGGDDSAASEQESTSKGKGKSDQDEENQTSNYRKMR